jgi:hypothetical protein
MVGELAACLPAECPQGELVEVAELPVKCAAVCRFSGGGHLLAAAGRNNVVAIYAVWSRQQVALLRGHASAVTGLSFSPGGLIIRASSGRGCPWLVAGTAGRRRQCAGGVNGALLLLSWGQPALCPLPALLSPAPPAAGQP